MLGVVFVHGFKSTPRVWNPLAELVAADDELASAVAEAPARFGYATGIWRPTGWRPWKEWRRQVIPSITTAADSLKEYLSTEAGEFENLVLIGHSQGGLVIQRCLVRMLSEGRGHEVARIRRVVQLATPNTGSELLKSVRRILIRGNSQDKALRPYDELVNDTLRDLMRAVVHAPAEPGQYTCRIPFSVYAGESDGIVTRASASSVFPEAAALPGDHFSIVRPYSKEHRTFTTVRRLLLDAVRQPPAERGVQNASDPPVSWIGADRYFHRTTSERYSHRWTLVGRDRHLQELSSFAHGERGQVGVLVGRGGVGKSKLLHAVSQKLLEAGDVQVRFWDGDAPYHRRAVSELPAGGVLLVIDDAHREADCMTAVIKDVREHNPDARILLSLRAYGQLQVRRELREARIAPDEVFRCDVDDLQVHEAEELAREALGVGFAHFAPRLAHAARDCPLLIVVGAELIRQGELDPAHFESDEKLRVELTDVYAAVIGGDASAYSDTRARVLRAVAALQPVRIGDEAFTSALSALAGQPIDHVRSHLDALEEEGVLITRGLTYRVVPDLLGDMLFAQAVYGRRRTHPTGYLDDVLEVAEGDARENLIVNAGRIDWQERSSRPSDLLDGLWSGVERRLGEADAQERRALLKTLEKVSYFQALPCLRVSMWILEHPLAAADGQPGRHPYADHGIQDAVCRVLRGIALDIEYFPQAADLLWLLAADDARDPSREQDHPLRVLAELASYSRIVGPTQYQELLIERVAHWLERDEPTRRDPLSVLAPLLAAEGEEHSWRSDAFVFTSFMIDPTHPPTAALRSRVLDLTFAQLSSTSPRRVAAALEMVKAAVLGPIGRTGQVDVQVRACWEKTHLATLTQLRTAVSDVVLPAALYIQLRCALQWLSEHGTDPVREACRTVFATIPPDLRNDLARALHGGPIDPPVDPSVRLDLEYRDRAQQELFATVAHELGSLDDAAAAKLVEDVIDELHELIGDEILHPRAFVLFLATTRTGLARALLSRAKRSPESQLAGQVSFLLIALVNTAGDAAVVLAEDLLPSGSLRLTHEVAHAFGLQRGPRGELMSGEEELLGALIGHEDAQTHRLALGAVHAIARTNKALAMRLLCAVRPADERFSIEQFAGLTGPHGTVVWQEIPQDFRDEFFDELRSRSSLEGYELESLLVELSHDEHRKVFDLLFDRAKALDNASAGYGYAPLPYSRPHQYRFRELEEFQGYLREVREWLTSTPASGWRSQIGPDLFTAVAGTVFDPTVRGVIEEYLAEPTTEKMNAVALMVHNAPRDLLEDVDFIGRCLRATAGRYR